MTNFNLKDYSSNQSVYATDNWFFRMNCLKEPIPGNESETMARSCPIKHHNAERGRGFGLAVVFAAGAKILHEFYHEFIELVCNYSKSHHDQL